MGALDGIKVIEIGTAIAGPFCGQILGDHGAEVIKIETIGDPGHKRTPIHKGLSLYHASMNRNKKSIALNLKSQEGQDVLYRLIEEADVLLTNFAAGVPERLGFGYDKVSKINPRIVMTHITGFGLTGPYRDKKAYDPIVQGMGGILHMTGEPDGSPMTIGVYVADHFSAAQGAVGTLMALYSRTMTGKGQLVDVAMLDSMISMHAFNFADTVLNKVNHKRTGTRISFTFSGIFPTKDGYVVIAPLSDKMWNSFCEAIGHDDWKTDRTEYSNMYKRVEDFDKLEEGFIQWSSKYSTEEVVQILDKADVPCGAVNTLEDVLRSPQAIDRNMVLPLNIPGFEEFVAAGIPIKFSATPYDKVSPPPFLSEHSDEILSNIGYSKEEIDEMVFRGTVTRYENELAKK